MVTVISESITAEITGKTFFRKGHYVTLLITIIMKNADVNIRRGEVIGKT